MTKNRKKYTRDFKLAIIGQVESGIKPLVQAARENGLHPSLVTRWRNEHARNPQTAFKGNGNAYKEEARIADLERMLGKAHAEIESLKKATEKLTERLHEERKKTLQRRDIL
jgi:transposase